MPLTLPATVSSLLVHEDGCDPRVVAVLAVPDSLEGTARLRARAQEVARSLIDSMVKQAPSDAEATALEEHHSVQWVNDTCCSVDHTHSGSVAFVYIDTTPLEVLDG